MIEAKIILPSWPRYAAIAQEFEETLLARFGGFTRSPSYGFWNGPGGPVGEPVNIYVVAIKAEAPELFALRGLARAAARRMGQEALYYVEDGHVEIVRLDAKPIPANDNQVDKRIDVV